MIVGEENDSESVGEIISMRSPIRRRSQTASLPASDAAMYSASVVERATIVCFLAFQATTHSESRKTNPPVDFRSPRSPAQSESENPLRDMSSGVSLLL